VVPEEVVLVIEALLDEEELVWERLDENVLDWLEEELLDERLLDRLEDKLEERLLDMLEDKLLDKRLEQLIGQDGAGAAVGRIVGVIAEAGYAHEQTEDIWATREHAGVANEGKPLVVKIVAVVNCEQKEAAAWACEFPLNALSQLTI
jgi:hypothetical protein